LKFESTNLSSRIIFNLFSIVKDIFNIDGEVKESAHARVNLIGEHTDYTGGYVMPTLLSFKNTIEITENNTNEFIVYSQYFKEKKSIQ
jgi:galactokinase